MGSIQILITILSYVLIWKQLGAGNIYILYRLSSLPPGPLEKRASLCPMDAFGIPPPPQASSAVPFLPSSPILVGPKVLFRQGISFPHWTLGPTPLHSPKGQGPMPDIPCPGTQRGTESQPGLWHCQHSKENSSTPLQRSLWMAAPKAPFHSGYRGGAGPRSSQNSPPLLDKQRGQESRAAASPCLPVQPAHWGNSEDQPGRTKGTCSKRGKDVTYS